MLESQDTAIGSQAPVVSVIVPVFNSTPTLPAVMVSSAIEIIAVRERSSPRDWDRFAAESGTSFRGSFDGSFWRFDRHLISRVARFSCYLSTANERIKI